MPTPTVSRSFCWPGRRSVSPRATRRPRRKLDRVVIMVVGRVVRSRRHHYVAATVHRHGMGGTVEGEGWPVVVASFPDHRAVTATIFGSVKGGVGGPILVGRVVGSPRRHDITAAVHRRCYRRRR